MHFIDVWIIHLPLAVPINSTGKKKFDIETNQKKEFNLWPKTSCYQKTIGRAPLFSFLFLLLEAQSTIPTLFPSLLNQEAVTTCNSHFHLRWSQEHYTGGCQLIQPHGKWYLHTVPSQTCCTKAASSIAYQILLVETALDKHKYTELADKQETHSWTHA